MKLSIWFPGRNYDPFVLLGDICYDVYNTVIYIPGFIAVFV